METLNRILLPVEFSERCVGAGRYARALANQFHSQVILLHVVESRLGYGGAEIGAPGPDWVEKIREERENVLQSFLEEEFRGLAVRRILLEGDPAKRIVEYAHQEKIDLIVLPTHGYGPFRRFLLGSVVAKVLHDADCPVFTGVHMEEAPPPEDIRFEQIVCALDLGPQSSRVLAWAAGFAKSAGSQLTLVHVAKAPAVVTVASPSGEEPEEIEQARESLRDLQREAGIEAEIEVVTGSLAEAMYECSARRGADLLVIGRGTSKGVIGRLRSNAYTLIRDSPCAVVSV
jgi:nucleotide-binding universal stress UspA family protein